MRELYRPRWPLLLALVVGVGALITLAYVPSQPSGDELPAQGGTYVEGVAGEPSIVNPLIAAFNEVDQDVTRLVFSGLVRLGPKGEVQPDLAEEPTITPDGLTYVFELRSGLLWHDGEPVDAYDVEFTIELIQDPQFGGDPDLAELFDGVEVEVQDERTVLMTLPQPFAPFLARGATVGILPEHLLRGLEAAELEETEFNDEPVGTGPFRLVELTATAAVFEPFRAYHLERPFLEQLELRFYRDDAALLTALLEEEVEGALFRSGLSSDALAAIDDERWVQRTLHATMYSLVYLNPRVDAFDSSLVRRALQHGLDRERLVEDVLGGQALMTDSPIVRDLWAYVAFPEAYAYDTALAEELLDRAGWEMDDSIRTNDGESFEVTLAASDDPLQMEVAGALALQWAELGIQVNVEVSGASTFVEDVLLPRDFEAALVSIDPGPDPDPYAFWHSSQTTSSGRNLANFSNADVDRLLENGRLAPSAADRADDYRAFQEIFSEEVPAILLYTPTYQYVVRSDLQGLTPGLLLSPSARFNDVQLWFVEKERVDDGGD